MNSDLSKEIRELKEKMQRMEVEKREQVTCALMFIYRKCSLLIANIANSCWSMGMVINIYLLIRSLKASIIEEQRHTTEQLKPQQQVWY